MTFWYQDWYLGFQLIDYAREAVRTWEWNPHIAILDAYLSPLDANGIFGNRIFAIGMLIFSPDTLIFPMFSTTNAVIFHILVTIAAISFLTFIMLRKRSFSFLTTISLLVSFFFLTPVFARISVGHIQLLGYFLVPIFVLLLRDLTVISQRSINIWIIKMTCLLTYSISLGSMHVFFQMTLLLLFHIPFFPRLFKATTLPPIVALTLTAFQTLPTLLDSRFGNLRSVYAGYGYNFFSSTGWHNETSSYNLSTIRDFLLTLVLHVREIFIHLFVALTDSNFAIISQGWEWTIDVGPVTIFLFLVYIVMSNKKTYLWRDNLWVFFAFCLSLSLFYRFLYLGVAEVFPISAIDRVPYRMLIYVLVWAILNSSHFLDQLLKRRNFSPSAVHSILSFIMVFNFIYLQKSFEGWKMKLKSEDIKLRGFDYAQSLPSYNVIDNSGDQLYLFHIQIGLVISIIGALFFSLCIIRALKKETQ